MSEEKKSDPFLARLINWEKMALSSLLTVMVKYFDCENIELSVNSRPEVASRMWYTLSFELPERYGHISRRRRFVSASRLDLMCERLISLLDREKLSETRLEWKQTLQNQQPHE